MKEFLRKTLIEILIVTNFFFFFPNKSYSIDDKVKEETKIENITEENKKEEENIPKRNYKIGETFIITDKTIANTFRIDSEKKGYRFNDKVMISYDIFGQEGEFGKMQTKKQRFDFNYIFFIQSLSKKEPFIEYYYSTDKPTRLNWKVLAGGIVKKILDVEFDIGYGYKWGEIKEKEKYKYDVLTMNLSNVKKFSKFTLKQDFKNIIPRDIEFNKQPIYDYRSLLSTPITESINGAVCFDLRYQKIPELLKSDWLNYSLKFGITFIPIK